MIRLGGLSFEVVPAEALSPAESRALSRLAGGGARLPDDAASARAPDASHRTPFVLELRGDLGASVEAARGTAGPSSDDDAPAAVDWRNGRVTVRHRRLAAELEPAAGTGWLRRDASVGWPLEVTLRAALAARLPLEGGLPLHAAGLVVEGWGTAFFGPSGAGKSTLAAASPHPAVSDEMVAIAPAGGRGFLLGGAGFWGTLEGGDRPSVLVPLAALVELDRGPALRVEPLDPTKALRRLVASTLVPPGPPLWSAALAATARLVREVPVFRLAWSALQPWEEVEEALRRAEAIGTSGLRASAGAARRGSPHRQGP
jgi:hypothetical protein